MGSSTSSQAKAIAKSKQKLKLDAHPMTLNDPIRWQGLKKKQATVMDTLELSNLLSQPVERLEFIIQFLENKGLFVEEGLLGQGGCGFILKAFNEKEEKLAVKILRCTNKDQIKDNKQEYMVLRQFNSKYVTKVCDQLQFEFDSANYLVILMERCAYDLRKYIANSKVKGKQKLPGLRELLKMVEQMVQGLIVLHSKNIIHLDIKPANILFGLDKVWKYADLGVSRKLTDNKQHISHVNGYTVDYSSPEQYQLMQLNASCKITKKSDIYSLGIVFMELTGVEIERKWLIQLKTQSTLFINENLNKQFSEFNEQVIIPMLKYNYQERIELDKLLIAIQDMLEGKSRPIDTQTIKKEDHKISLPDEDDPLNFDSHKYYQIRKKQETERQQQARNSIESSATEKIPRDETILTIQKSHQQLSQPATQENQQQQQYSPKRLKCNRLEQSPTRLSRNLIPSQFMVSNGESQQLNEFGSLKLEDKKLSQGEQYQSEQSPKNEIVLPILRLSDNHSQSDNYSSQNRMQDNRLRHLSNPGIRKSGFSIELSPTFQEIPRLSMYGQQVLDQSPIRQQQQLLPKQSLNFEAYTQRILEKDERKSMIQLMPSYSQGNYNQRSIMSESRQINEQSTGRQQQQSQLAMIAQKQFFQNSPR